MRESEFIGLQAYVIATWPQAGQWPEESWSVWAAELASVPAEAAVAALRGFAREGQAFPPTWGQVYQRAAQVTGEAGPSFGEADAEVRDQIDATERKLQWSHPLVAFYVKSMGWERLRLAPTPQDARAYGPWMNEARKTYEDCRQKLMSAPPLAPALLMVPPSPAQIARGDAAASLQAADEPPPLLEAPESTEEGRRLREQYGLPPGRPEE
jgi:hypothetical protein